MVIDLSYEQTKAWDLLENEKSSDSNILSNNVSTVLFGGQAGGGKTTLICLWQIHRRLKYPETIGYIGRERLKDLKESTLVTFFDIAKMMGLQSEVHYRYNDQKSIITFHNGSKIMLLDLFYYPSDPDFHSLGSKEYTDGAIEEGATVSEKAASILRTRTRYKHDVYKLTRKQLITCNPHDGWIKDKVIIPYFDGNLKDNFSFVPATLESNPNKEFVKLYKETLLSDTDEYDRARLLHGDWFATPKTGGEFYKHYNEQAHTCDIKYNPDLPIHMTWDFNVNPYITCIIIQVQGKAAYIIDEICLESPDNYTAAVCKEFKNKYNHHVSGLFVYGDPSGKQQDTRNEKGHNDYSIMERELQNYNPKFRVPHKHPSVVTRGNFINAIFKNNYDDIQLWINKTCVKTKEDFSFIKEDSDGTKKKQKSRNVHTGVTYEKWGHVTDAIDYWITECFKSSYNKFQTGGNKPVEYLLGQRIKKRSF